MIARVANLAYTVEPRCNGYSLLTDYSSGTGRWSGLSDVEGPGYSGLGYNGHSIIKDEFSGPVRVVAVLF